MVGLKLLNVVVLVCLFCVCGHAGALDAFIYTEAPRYFTGGAERFPGGATLQIVENGRKRPLVPGFAASADATMSSDGRTVLFSGKRAPADPWQIWEVAIRGGDPRRVTHFTDDAITPFYLTGERIVYARRTRSGFQLEVEIDGKSIDRLTYVPGDHTVTDVLRDGRILFDAPHPGSKGRDVYTVRTDGSDVQTYRCRHDADRHSGRETSGGDVVFETAGRLARFTSSSASALELPAAQGEFMGAVAEVEAGDFLVSFRPDPKQPFGIYRWMPGKGEPVLVWRATGVNAVQPVIVRSRPVPNRLPSALGDREGANLLCLNVYESQAPIPDAVVAWVRAWALDDNGKQVILGKAPVERDGSFFVQMPANRAIRFELLDQSEKTVAAEKGWIWSRRGEQRVCVGCHAGPERAPENRVPAVLLRTTDPVKMLPVETAKGGRQ